VTETTAHITREARLRWVSIEQMKVSPRAQRDLVQARVDRISSAFDLEQVGTPTVNLRDGAWYIIDGQHRVEALRQIGWGDQQIQCWAYEGLSEQDEAEKFLKLNDVLAVHAFARFRVAVRAGRDDEVAIDRIVQAAGLRISQDKGDGAISAVGTLLRVYHRSDEATLARTLEVIREAYGDPGLEAAVIDGVGLLCQRYNGDLDLESAVSRLARAHGGVNALLGRAENLRKQTGNRRGHCVAAAAVEIINAGRGGKKLPSWWRAEGDSAS